MKNVIASVLLGLLCGCAALTESSSTMAPERAAKGAAVRRDEFKKYTAVDSMKIRLGDRMATDAYQLTAQRQDGSDTISYFLTFESTRGEWAFWKEILTLDGRSLLVDSTPRNTVSRTSLVYDAIVVRLSPEDVQQMAQRPVKLKVYGERATKEFETDVPIVAGFLMRSREVLK